MSLFLALNSKEYIFKSVGNQTIEEAIERQLSGFQTFFKLSAFVFNARKKLRFGTALG